MDEYRLELLIDELSKTFQTQIDELKDQIKKLKIEIDDNNNELTHTVKDRYY